MNILLVTIDGGGNIPPVLHVVKQLVQKGHVVTVLSEPCLREIVIASGAQFVPFTQYFTKSDRRQDIFNDWKKDNNSFKTVIFGPAEIVVQETLENINLLNIDLLIADVLMPTALIAGEAKNIPTVCLFHMPEYLPGKNRPPGSLGLLPGKGYIGHLRDKMLGKVFQFIFNKYLPPVNKIRKQLDLPAYQQLSDIFHSCNLRCIQTSETFDFPIYPKPLNVLYAGPVLDNPDWINEDNASIPSPKQLPLVIVALSTTFQNQKNVIQRCIHALGALPVNGLVTLGPAMANETFDVPHNVTVLAHASHRKIFPIADCVITHAGHGTVMRALSNGVPMVCLPMGRDQNDNAAKVVYHKAGLRLSRNASPKKISSAVKKILSDTGYKMNAQRIGAIIRKDAGEDLIVPAVEELFASKSKGKGM